MEYFQVRYDSRVVNYDRRGFIRLATGLCQQCLPISLFSVFYFRESSSFTSVKAPTHVSTDSSTSSQKTFPSATANWPPDFTILPLSIPGN